VRRAEIIAFQAGAAGFNVRDIDAARVKLNGVAPERWSIEDVTAPSTVSSCKCPSIRADKIPDLSLKFSAPDVAETLSDYPSGSNIELTLTGYLKDGTPIRGSDCVKIVK
jgi:hypothetical protein